MKLLPGQQHSQPKKPLRAGRGQLGSLGLFKALRGTTACSLLALFSLLFLPIPLFPSPVHSIFSFLLTLNPRSSSLPSSGFDRTEWKGVWFQAISVLGVFQPHLPGGPMRCSECGHLLDRLDWLVSPWPLSALLHPAGPGRLPWRTS